jgi:hypothetical protein
MSNFPTIKINNNTGALKKIFNLSNVHIPDARNNPYIKDKLSAGYVAPDEALKTSTKDYLGNLLGTPVFADVTLQGGSYTDNITGKTITYPEIKLATVLLTVDFTARIVKTEIQGRDGTVKEYIGQDDAKVTIQGIITGTNGHYPAYEVGQLNLWAKAPVTKGATSTFLQNLGVDNLVVESFSLPQIAGGYSYQTFSINCISDLPVELKIVNNA